jgi:hypothetical protein
MSNETARRLERARPPETPRRPNRREPHSRHGYTANFTGRPGTEPKTTITTAAVVKTNRPASSIRQRESRAGGVSGCSSNASPNGANTRMPTTCAIHKASQASLKTAPNAMRVVSAPTKAPIGALISAHTHARPRMPLRRSTLNADGNNDRSSHAPVTASSVFASQ